MAASAGLSARPKQGDKNDRSTKTVPLIVEKKQDRPFRVCGFNVEASNLKHSKLFLPVPKTRMKDYKNKK
jgi:hypothetical protein